MTICPFKQDTDYDLEKDRYKHECTDDCALYTSLDYAHGACALYRMQYMLSGICDSLDAISRTVRENTDHYPSWYEVNRYISYCRMQ